MANPLVGMNLPSKILEGRERILCCLQQNGAETEVVDLLALQKTYLSEYGTYLNKEELRRYFAKMHIKDVFDKYFDRDIEMTTDPEQTGSLFLKMKRPLEEALADPPVAPKLPTVGGRAKASETIYVKKPNLVPLPNTRRLVQQKPSFVEEPAAARVVKGVGSSARQTTTTTSSASTVRKTPRKSTSAVVAAAVKKPVNIWAVDDDDEEEGEEEELEVVQQTKPPPATNKVQTNKASVKPKQQPLAAKGLYSDPEEGEDDDEEEDGEEQFGDDALEANNRMLSEQTGLEEEDGSEEFVVPMEGKQKKKVEEEVISSFGFNRRMRAAKQKLEEERELAAWMKELRCAEEEEEVGWEEEKAAEENGRFAAEKRKQTAKTIKKALLGCGGGTSTAKKVKPTVGKRLAPNPAERLISDEEEEEGEEQKEEDDDASTEPEIIMSEKSAPPPPKPKGRLVGGEKSGGGIGIKMKRPTVFGVCLAEASEAEGEEEEEGSWEQEGVGQQQLADTTATCSPDGGEDDYEELSTDQRYTLICYITIVVGLELVVKAPFLHASLAHKLPFYAAHFGSSPAQLVKFVRANCAQTVQVAKEGTAAAANVDLLCYVDQHDQQMRKFVTMFGKTVDKKLVGTAQQQQQ